MTYAEMLALARSKLNPRVYDKYFSAGFVSAVLEGANGKYYTGVNLDLACGLGFCAERVVRRIVCVDEKGALMTPCGSCREFLFQLSRENVRTEFLLGIDPLVVSQLGKLLPDPWQTGRE